MDIAQDHKHHRKTQQRIQTKNKAHGDRGRGEILLYPPRLYCSKNGTALEVKPHWKGAQKPASLEDFGAVKIYTIYLTLPVISVKRGMRRSISARAKWPGFGLSGAISCLRQL